MKRSYHGTFTHTDDLADAKVILDFFKGTKYDAHANKEEPNEVVVTGLTSWDIIEGGKEAEEIENLTGEIDENHEYLVLYFKGGCVNIYRNSHVVMFII